MAVEAERTVRFRRLPRAIREQQILDAAVTVFSHRGYHSASMDDIAETAGISKPMLYAYLGSKEDLFAASIRREVSRLVEVINAELHPELSLDEQLWRGLQAFFTFVDTHRDSWRVLYRQARSQGGPFAAEAGRMRNLVVDLVQSLLSRAVGEHNAGLRTAFPALDDDLKGMALALVGAGESIADWLLDHPGQSPTAAAARMMNFAWAGLGNLLNGVVWRPSRTEHPTMSKRSAKPERSQAMGAAGRAAGNVTAD